MNVNETIARWLGWTDIESWLEGYGIPPGGSPNTAKLVPLYDSGRAFWHGDDGLLAEIERQGGDKDSLSRDLHREWMSQRVEAEDPPFDRQMPYADEIAAAYLRATPAQLAAALVEVIEEEE